MFNPAFHARRLAFCTCAGLLLLATPAAAQTIDNVTISGHPTDLLLLDGTRATYTVTIEGHGIGGGVIYWSVLDEDAGVDDTLIDETYENALSAGNWTIVRSFDLWSVSGDVAGGYGPCDEGLPEDPAEVYVLIEDTSGTINDIGRSGIRYVKCGEPLMLSTMGVPGGAMSFDVMKVNPTKQVALIYAFGAGDHSKFNPLLGRSVTTGLATAGFAVAIIGASDATGAFVHVSNVPAQAAGLVHVQALDLSTNILSNVVAL